MSECTHDCSTCGANCSSRQQQKPANEFEAPMNALSKVKKVYAVFHGVTGYIFYLRFINGAVGTKRKAHGAKA